MNSSSFSSSVWLGQCVSLRLSVHICKRQFDWQHLVSEDVTQAFKWKWDHIDQFCDKGVVTDSHAFPNGEHLRFWSNIFKTSKSKKPAEFKEVFFKVLVWISCTLKPGLDSRLGARHVKPPGGQLDIWKCIKHLNNKQNDRIWLYSHWRSEKVGLFIFASYCRLEAAN